MVHQLPPLPPEALLSGSLARSKGPPERGPCPHPSEGSHQGEALRRWIWRQVQASRWSREALPGALLGLQDIYLHLLDRPFLAGSLTETTDVFPRGRPRIIHPWGVVGRVDFVPDDPCSSPYTGLFAHKTRGIARLSVGMIKGWPGSFVPGVALKWPVERHPSLNVLMVHQTTGQADPSHFTRVMRTAVPPPPVDQAEHILDAIFQEVMDTLAPEAEAEARRIPLEPLAAVTPSGEIVKTPVAPWSLECVAPPRLARRWPEVLAASPDPGDARHALLTLNQNTVLYEVQARAAADAPALPIGRLILRGRFEASTFGDHCLFFQHPLPPGALTKWPEPTPRNVL